ncbi:carbohydrate esterase family 4 protein [Hymenopellis radicata]|nr:carbohydrate esterase family 4 protein [Hymenopellis radicata]
MFTLIGATISLTLTALVSGSAVPMRRQAGQAFTSCSVPNTAAITFDDGPFTWTREIVDMLDAKGAKGTFFVNGHNYECIYGDEASDHIRYAYGQGHQIASHTWAHKNLASISREEVDSEMTGVDQALERIIGASPAMMRPPYGAYNDDVLSVAAAHNQVVVTWDFDSQDSAGVPAGQSNAMYDGLVGGRPGSILTLNHETYESTVREVLPHAIDALQSAGYKLVTVAECLGLEAYTKVGAPGTPDASWTC